MRIRVIFIGHESREFIAEQKKYREQLVSTGTRIDITSIKEGPGRQHLSGKENSPLKKMKQM